MSHSSAPVATSPHGGRAHAIVPLAVFEAIRNLDVPGIDDRDEFHQEWSSKRLGMSHPVVSQIERFRKLARENRRVGREEVIAILRLASRRSDAGLVYTDAGRLVGRHAALRASSTARALWRMLTGRPKERVGLALVRSVAWRVLGTRVDLKDGLVGASLPDSPAVLASPSGAACGLYGSALAELLRIFTSFDGALLHTECRARGDAICYWRAATLAEE